MPEDMGETRQTGFQVETTSLGLLACRRVTVGDRMRVAKQLGASPVPAPTDYARALLSSVATKPDGEAVQAAEANTLTVDELERFAEGILHMHEGLRGSDWTPGQPALMALAVGLEERQKRTSEIGRLTGFTSAASVSDIQDRFIGASARGASLFSGGAKVGTATPIADRLATVVAEMPRPSDTTLEIVQERLAAFKSGLAEGEEAMMVAVSAPGGPCFFVQDIEALSKEMIVLKGSDDRGGLVEVVQHHSQCNIMILPVKKPAAKGPLGFTTKTGDA